MSSLIGVWDSLNPYPLALPPGSLPSNVLAQVHTRLLHSSFIAVRGPWRRSIISFLPRKSAQISFGALQIKAGHPTNIRLSGYSEYLFPRLVEIGRNRIPSIGVYSFWTATDHTRQASSSSNVLLIKLRLFI